MRYTVLHDEDNSTKAVLVRFGLSVAAAAFALLAVASAMIVMSTVASFSLITIAIIDWVIAMVGFVGGYNRATE